MKLVTLVIAGALGCGVMQAKAAEQPASASASQAPSAQVEPQAVEALSRMSTYLRSIPAFQINLQVN